MKSILQSPEWAEFKKSQGFEILMLGDIYVHKRALPYGKNFLYLPEVNASDISPQQIEELKEITKQQKSIFTRLEILDRFNESSYKLIRSFGFEKAFEQVQPKWRQIINLSQSEEEISSQMKQKGRYNIKVAQKHDVLIKTSKDENAIKIFHQLYMQTGEREKLSGRSIEYFKKMLDSFSETEYLEIYIATYKNEPVAAAIISFYDGVASYLYGGSSRSKKEVMAPYLMHWQIIKDAKSKGMTKYDMIGRAKPEDEKSKWAGVTRFKEQFGGEAVEILGSFDCVNQKLAYTLFKIAEKRRRKSD